MKQIRVDVEKCSGCGQCALTCSFKNVGKFELNQSNIRIVQWEDICLSVPHLCQQCGDTPCIVACPTEAISVNPLTGAIVIDPDLCTQCYNCEKSAATRSSISIWKDTRSPAICAAENRNALPSVSRVR